MAIDLRTCSSARILLPRVCPLKKSPCFRFNQWHSLTLPGGGGDHKNFLLEGSNEVDKPDGLKMMNNGENKDFRGAGSQGAEEEPLISMSGVRFIRAS